MKSQLSLLAAVVCLTLSATSHASDLYYTITGGTLSPTGSFSGSFYMDPLTEKIDGGSIIASDGTNTYTFYNPGNDSGTPGFELFTDDNSNVFRLALNGPTSDLQVNTWASNAFGDTALITAAGLRFDASGPATIVDPPAPAPAPEPSSLFLLGTGVLGVAGTIRRRFLKA